MHKPPSFTHEFGSRIKTVCDLIGTSKNAAVAAGVSTDQLDRYVKGSSKVSFMALYGLSQATGVSLDWLATGEGPMRREEAGHAQPQETDGITADMVFGAWKEVEEMFIEEDLDVSLKETRELVHAICVQAVEDARNAKEVEEKVISLMSLKKMINNAKPFLRLNHKLFKR